MVGIFTQICEPRMPCDVRAKNRVLVWDCQWKKTPCIYSWVWHQVSPCLSFFGTNAVKLWMLCFHERNMSSVEVMINAGCVKALLSHVGGKRCPSRISSWIHLPLVSSFPPQHPACWYPVEMERLVCLVMLELTCWASCCMDLIGKFTVESDCKDVIETWGYVCIFCWLVYLPAYLSD